MTTKRSFFERLSGAAAADAFDSFDDEIGSSPVKDLARIAHDEEAADAEGQLPVDVHQTANEIVIRAFVAGVRPDELNISISRDRVEIEGSRMERGEQVLGSDYFSRELFWGSFTRAIMLPQEIDVDGSSAHTKDGLLTIILPKLDKARQTKLKVKAG